MMLTLVTAIPPASDIETYNEVQVSSPTIGVYHLKNGLAYVRVADTMAACPDTWDEVYSTMHELILRNRIDRSWGLR